jgi:large subunit ribosomal protein L9
MQVILLERIARLGQMGDTVTVKDGFARNFLLPQGKALRANKANMARFESERVELEARNLDRKNEASAIHEKLNGTSYVVIRSAGETGQLYGSVSTRDIAGALEEAGFRVARSQVTLQNPIKTIGLHSVEVVLHPEVTGIVTINVARSEDEATRQAAGEDLTSRDARFEIDRTEEDDLDLEEIFDNPDAAHLDEEGADGEAEASDGETAA